MNVILIGMPGSGKSTVGVVLAKLLGLHFCDTDLVLQQHCGKKLQEIIRTEGDAAFFRHEEEVLAALDVQNTVIATGGSAVYSRSAMLYLKEHGYVYYLSLPVEQVEKRLHNIKTRGIAMRPGDSIEDVFRRRRKLYEEYADITVDCAGKSIEEIVEEIVGEHSLIAGR